MRFEKLLKVAVTGGASDIILKVGTVPRFRLAGQLVDLQGDFVVSADIMTQWLQGIIPPHLRDKINKIEDIDFAHESEQNYRFRVNVFRQQRQFAMVLRVINNHIKTLEELQLPSIMKQLAFEKRGLILVTGATGSGKSTTLAAMVEKINQNRSSHVITIEDPIEYTYQEKSATINQREIGLDTLSFASALRSSLRQNPDAILVGELRDTETVETALHAAETGHLVFSTLHTKDAMESLTRIQSFFQPHHHDLIKQMLAQTLRAVISQRLIPRRDKKGMVPAIEIMTTSKLIQDIILAGRSWDIPEVIQKGAKYGMQSFDQSIMDLYSRGIISRDTAISAASNPSDLELALSGVANPS